MTNPLIEKWEELNRPKEEHLPKNTKAEYELDPNFVEKLKDLNTLSTVLVGSGITASNYVSANNSSVSYTPYRPLTNCDYDASVRNVFMQVADKVKYGSAMVRNATMEMDMIGSLSAGKKMTFEVYVYD